MINNHKYGYGELLTLVQKEGSRVNARGLWAQEFQGLTTTFSAGTLVKRPGINYRLGYMEMLQLLAGSFNVDLIKAVAPKANHDLFTPQMAYGPRVAWQLSGVVSLLQADPASRRAVLFFTTPSETEDEIPCTISVQFLLRKDQLHAEVTMRSWDLVKGLAYDVMMFGGLTLAVAQVLGCSPGAIRVRAGSAHIYESDLPVKASPSSGKFMLPEGLTSLSEIRQWALDQTACGTSWINGLPGGMRIIDES
jgi:hypothetical protein